MTYESARRKEIRQTHVRQIEEFARTYKKNKPTIVLVPGGMGSQIDRSKKPYRGAASLPFRYDPIWMDPGIIFEKDALRLEILPNFHDLDKHVCIPNGPLRFLIKPYDATEDYFRDRNFNYTVFGFDWRRSVRESAGFLQFFLKTLKQRVTELWQEDPLPNTTILCHSMGGLVAKVFLHKVFKTNTKAADVRAWMSRLVTVATPFYGTATHMTRYYKGQEPLNIIYSAKKLARLTGTLAGTYILKKAKHHQELLEHPETLRVIWRLIQKNRMPKSVRVPDKILSGPKASLKATEKFMTQVAAGKIKRTDQKALDKKVWRRIVKEANLC